MRIFRVSPNPSLLVYTKNGDIYSHQILITSSNMYVRLGCIRVLKTLAVYIITSVPIQYVTCDCLSQMCDEAHGSGRLAQDAIIS